MKSKWIFCKNCGKSFKSTIVLEQFCSEKCINEWSNGDIKKVLSLSKSYGLKDNSKYNRWKKAVRKKWNLNCALCGSNLKLHAHHIVHWMDDLELRYEESNGLLACNECHSIIHGYTIGTKEEILKDKKNVSLIRKKYIKVAKLKFRKSK